MLLVDDCVGEARDGKDVEKSGECGRDAGPRAGELKGAGGMVKLNGLKGAA